jgi:eukaryotic-like serine/threonine-protein kinase
MDMTLENGELLKDRYRILDILGQGGMGAVYRAVDENLDVVVAVKENSFLTEEYARQFRREAKILASLRHPNLPRVFDYFVLDQQGQYLVMDYIEGDDLRQWMSREEEITEIEVLQIGIAICDALIYLHSQDPPIIHRDIKPGNVKITPNGEVVLVDFGLVKLMNDKEITTTAARAMTPGYSPPEQYGQAHTDHRSDIFLLGATLYAALAGYLPEDSLARSTGKAKLTPLRSYNPSVSSKTGKAIDKALRLRFEERWQSAELFKNGLLNALENFPKEVRKSNRLAGVNSQRIQNHMDGSSDAGDVKGFRKLWMKLSGRRKGMDPTWLIFSLMIFLLLILLSLYLINPKGLQRLFNPPLQRRPTTTRVLQGNSTSVPVAALTQGTQESSPTDSSGGGDSLPQFVTPSPTITGGGSGWLAFVSERTGMPQIWLINVQNGEMNQLTNLTDGACQPDWSPDGSQIVFTSPCGSKRARYPGSSLYIADVLSGILTPLPASLEGDFDPAWSSDGRWIAFTSIVNGQMQLMKVRVDDLSVVMLSDGGYDDSDPAWSADGRRLAFVRLRSVGQIWLMDADGGNAVQFTLSGAIDNSNPEWYPDENLILFSQVMGLGSPSKQIFGMRIEDLGEHEEYPILPGTAFDYIPLMDNVSVSPDGYWLAFDYWYYNVQSDIYIMTFPGANLIQLTEHSEMDYDPAWRPITD